MHANRVYLCTFMTFLCLLAARAQNEEELKAIAELEMAGLELQDECEFLASTYKSSLISNTFSEKVNLHMSRCVTLLPFSVIFIGR
jgi:pantothenate kinase-related protein Tda10